MNILQGPRLILRPWRDDDLDAFARMSSDPKVMELLYPLKGRAEMDGWVKLMRDHYVKHDFEFLVAEIPGVNPWIGVVGLRHVSFEAPFTPAVEIGWRFDSAYWGQGYATEAARLALQDGFERLGLAEIVAFTIPVNVRSRRVMERLGMSHTESDDFDHPRLSADHPFRRHLLYRLKRENFRA